MDSKRHLIRTDQAPAPVGVYSQGAVGNAMIFTAGQIPIDPVTGAWLNDSIETAARQVLKNVIAVVEAGGGSVDTILKLTVFLKDMKDFAAVNRIFTEFFPGDAPARSAVEVAALPKDALLEIEAVALRL